ncbi:MAG: cytochrome C biogenesis protein [Calditerrivibrio nitroreducens]|uniref:Cytochrome C biogenesis protein n=1 Tax=Calditerrivibrio nitroreducens TaxID=477976 RepID=A0A2J6WJK6_9BACT|nr:MAG: cytochrome C biogenesis protein [Calditerrivibrio nitroreducens]
MIEAIFSNINYLVSQQIAIAMVAAFVWGIISVIISPCHLSGIPLICGYLMKRTENIKSAFWLSSIFSFGVLISIAIIGVVTISLGRIFGDVGILGDLLVGALFIVFGAYLLGIVNLNWNGFQYKSAKVGILSVFVMGFVFGMGLGPCTFAYIAPVVGFTFKMSSTKILRPAILLLFYAAGHTLTIAIAGVSGNLVSKFLKFNEKLKFLNLFQKIIGIALIIIGIFYLF